MAAAAPAPASSSNRVSASLAAHSMLLNEVITDCNRQRRGHTACLADPVVLAGFPTDKTQQHPKPNQKQPRKSTCCV